MTSSLIAKAQNLERVIICLAFLERRIKLMSESILDPNQQVIVPGQNNEFDIVSDDIYYCMLDSKNYTDFTR
jgi:hypothetical protein